MTQAQVPAQGRYAPPTAHVEDVPEFSGDGPALARRSSRFWAAMIDTGISLTVLYLISSLTPWNPFRNADGWQVIAVRFAVGFGLFLVIHGWLLAQRGQTVGKAAMRVRIVRMDGGRANAWQLFGLRYGIGWVLASVPVAGGIYAMIDALVIFRDSRRCLHDVIAGTKVVTA